MLDDRVLIESQVRQLSVDPEVCCLIWLVLFDELLGPWLFVFFPLYMFEPFELRTSDVCDQ